MHHRGLGYELFGLPMQSWCQFMPKGLLLKSEGFASDGRQSTARRVAIATGHMPFMFVPEALRALPADVLT
jgi:hypothetical protein